jgi:hypothetical protein
MIRIPEGFAAIKGYPGYFWHLEEKKLYTMKIDGILKPLKKQKGFNRGWQQIPPHYKISHRGTPKILVDHWIVGKLLIHEGEIPVKENEI